MNPILQRLNRIAELFGSKAALSRQLGKKSDFLNSYFNKDSIPGGELLAELHRQGISADWLLSGEGSMFAKNVAGEVLRAKTGIGNTGEVVDIGDEVEGIRVLKQDTVQQIIRLLTQNEENKV